MKLLYTLLATLFISTLVQAQEVNDQNPRFAESRDRYMNKTDSLLITQGTTVHNIYKAYDWSQMREDHQYNRRDNRNQRRLARAQAPRYYNYPWINRMNTPLGWRLNPNFGYNTGNWFFGR